MIQLRDDLLIVLSSLNFLLDRHLKHPDWSIFQSQMLFFKINKKNKQTKKTHNKRTNYVQNLLLKLL